MSQDTRKDKRAKVVSLNVRYKSATVDEFIENHSHDVSKGGIFRKRKGRTAGTRSYMSPEQVRGEALDGRADIYSFGATMYEVITGRPPFRAGSPVELLNKQITEKPQSPRSIKFQNGLGGWRPPWLLSLLPRTTRRFKPKRLLQLRR